MWNTEHRKALIRHARIGPRNLPQHRIEHPARLVTWVQVQNDNDGNSNQRPSPSVIKSIGEIYRIKGTRAGNFECKALNEEAYDVECQLSGRLAHSEVGDEDGKKFDSFHPEEEEEEEGEGYRKPPSRYSYWKDSSSPALAKAREDFETIVRKESCDESYFDVPTFEEIHQGIESMHFSTQATSLRLLLQCQHLRGVANPCSEMEFTCRTTSTSKESNQAPSSLSANLLRRHQHPLPDESSMCISTETERVKIKDVANTTISRLRGSRWSINKNDIILIVEGDTRHELARVQRVLYVMGAPYLISELLSTPGKYSFNRIERIKAVDWNNYPNATALKQHLAHENSVNLILERVRKSHTHLTAAATPSRDKVKKHFEYFSESKCMENHLLNISDNESEEEEEVCASIASCGEELHKNFMLEESPEEPEQIHKSAEEAKRHTGLTFRASRRSKIDALWGANLGRVWSNVFTP